MKRTLAVLGSAMLWIALGSPAVAKTDGKEVANTGAHIHYAHSYAAAMAEAKERGCVIFATIHEDGWKYCTEMHRSVLDDADFIAWANENVVVLVAHLPTSHKKLDVAKPEKGEPKSQCSLYGAVTCDEHNQIFKDLVKEKASKDDKDKKPAPKAKKGESADALPKIEMDGFPSSYLISPDGTVEKHGGDRAPGSCRSGIEAFQAKFDENPLSVSKLEDVRKSWADSDKAFLGSKWKATLDALAKVEASVGGKLPKAWVEKEKARLDAVNAKVVAKFAELKKGKDAAAVAKAVQALHDDVAVTLASGPLPVVADLEAFLKGDGAANPPAPAK